MMNVIQQTEYFYFRYFIYILMVKLLVLRLLLQKIIEQQEQIYHHLLDEGHALKVLPVFFLLFITEKIRFPVGNLFLFPLKRRV